MAKPRIGLFGGSFNPIHNGHLHLMSAAKEQLQLEQVILLPARVSPFKQHQTDMVSAADRYAMCQLAVEDFSDCRVDDFELQQKGVSYSLFSARHFSTCFPNHQLIWLMGSDMFLQFQQWYHWEEFLEYAALGVLARSDADQEKIAIQQERLLPYGTIFLCEVPVSTVSSTKIREKCKKQENFSCYLPQKVVQYIISHGFYKENQMRKES
ncbi:MAG: nicotinate (nicotinamide) nucleotide adenylyltransferase [Ruminococcus sp.]|nr:nicotinate (nicotinamide) nucleotide adenylyltransferase [Ruminococcus sp.]